MCHSPALCHVEFRVRPEDAALLAVDIFGMFLVFINLVQKMLLYVSQLFNLDHHEHAGQALLQCVCGGEQQQNIAATCGMPLEHRGCSVCCDRPGQGHFRKRCCSLYKCLICFYCINQNLTDGASKAAVYR